MAKCKMNQHSKHLQGQSNYRLHQSKPLAIKHYSLTQQGAECLFCVAQHHLEPVARGKNHFNQPLCCRHSAITAWRLSRVK